MQLQQFEGDVELFKNPYTSDDKLPVRFYIGAERDDEASDREGRDIFRDVECIIIYNTKDNIIERPLRDTDKQRWPRAYAAWKATGESIPGAGGTKLEQFPGITKAQIEELKYFKVFTVEQLADLPDTVSQKFMGAQKLKTVAKAYMEAAAGAAPLLRMTKMLEERDLQIKSLADQVLALSNRMEELMAGKDIGVPAPMKVAKR